MYPASGFGVLGSWHLATERPSRIFKISISYKNSLYFFMDVQKSIATCLKKFATFNGRASRSEYWWFQFFYALVAFFAVIIDSMFVDNSVSWGPLEIVSTIILFLPATAVLARRLHDVNRSGWWMLISITIIGLIPLIIWSVAEGSNKKNRFGPPINLKNNTQNQDP